MMRSSVLFALFASVLVFGCSSSSSQEVDPTSREALQKAPAIQYGCKYKQVSSYSLDGEGIGDSSHDMCAQGDLCSEVSSPSDFGGYAGDSTYTSSSYNTGFTMFVGTCSDPTPITCDEYPKTTACDACATSTCCTVFYLVDHDPNAKAILDCADECKDDKACIQRCVSNGEPSASKNVQELAKCLTGSCGSACGG